MNELDKISQDITGRLGVQFAYYREDLPTKDVPICDRQFDEITDDGEHVFFRFSYKQNGYIGVLYSVAEEVKRYALLLPAYIESFSEKEADLTKSEYLKRILLGECTSKSVLKFENKFSVGGYQCFVLVVHAQKYMNETLGLISQYTGNSLDTVVRIDEEHCAFVKFLKADEQEYHSSSDYAEFLVQSIKEEVGVDVVVGVGSTVKGLKDASLSYSQASSALRYALVFEDKGSVHTYREYMLVKMLEDASESKLMQYLSELMDDNSKEILEEEEMVSTAEEFLRCSLNVSETSRNLFMHRNTLLYRLDKIEKATGLNIRLFPDAVSFRVLTILYKLLGK